jgi:apolipoprotein N-acyltransferase
MNGSSRPRRLHLLLLALLSSVLLPLALPNEFMGGAIRIIGLHPDESFFWGNAILGLVCLAPVFYAIAAAPTFGFASLLGVVFGGVSTALANYWLMFFQGYSFWTFGGPILGYIGLNALLFPFLRGLARVGNGRFRPFLLAFGWMVYEYFKSVGFFGYPWGLIAYPLGGFLPLIQVVDTTGIWGLSFLMALVNVLVAEYALSCPAFRSSFMLGPGHVSWRAMPFLRQAVFAVVLVACVLVYGLIRLSLPIPSTSTASLLLVQQNSDPWDEGNPNNNSLKVNLDLTGEGARASATPPDLAVWSESSVTSVYVENGRQLVPLKNDLAPGVRQAGVPVLFGGVVIVDRRKEQAMNASVLISPEGAVLDTYGKIHGVPFAETIPFFEFPAVQKFFRNVVGVWNPWVSGKRFTIYHIPLRAGGSLEFGTPICFEDAFSNLCRGYVTRGADMLVNITNDSWSKTWSSEIQHFAVARFRAVENRRVLVRSTNGGLSAVVGPWGEIRARMPFFERTWKKVDVPVFEAARITPYTRFGDWFAWAAILLIFVTLVLDVLPKKRAVPPQLMPGWDSLSGFTR